MRPFKKGVYHSFNWRGWVDFGTGALGDMACHTTNMPIMALKLFDADAVTAVKNPGIFEGETFPGSSHLLFEFGKRDGLPPCKFHWYDGGELPPEAIIKQLTRIIPTESNQAKRRWSENEWCCCCWKQGCPVLTGFIWSTLFSFTRRRFC